MFIFWKHTDHVIQGLRVDNNAFHVRVREDKVERIRGKGARDGGDEKARENK
jgi:hypothetical protein